MSQDRIDAYVAGTLSPAERAAFEQSMHADAALAAQVMQHAARFAASQGPTRDHPERVSVFQHFKRELWDENRLPWHRRMRVWEFALGGAAAAAVAYAALYLDHQSRTAVELEGAARAPDAPLSDTSE